MKKKTNSLEQAISDIESTYGKGAIMQLNGETLEIESIPSGSITLDFALGKGFPRGRITEIYGGEGAGKTTLALHAIAGVQKEGKIAAIIDVEHALNVEWARKVGVDTDKLWISQPNCGEEAMDIVEALVRSSGVDIIVVDSVAALVPTSELTGEMGASHIGLQARLMSQAMRKLTSALRESNTCLIFINQIRQKVGVIFGSPETQPGGNALKYYSSIRLDLRRIATLKDSKGEAFGIRVRGRVVKNKVAPPFKTAEFTVLFDSGISYEEDLIDLAVNQEIIVKSGAWFNYKDIKLGQGKENARNFLKDNSELAEEIKNSLDF